MLATPVTYNINYYYSSDHGKLIFTIKSGELRWKEKSGAPLRIKTVNFTNKT